MRAMRSPVVIVTAIALVLRLVCAPGLIASDDLGYSDYAAQIATATFTPEAHHYAHRYGITVPVAAVYALCGVSEWTTIAVPLLAATVSVALLVRIALDLFTTRVAWIAGLLYATFPLAMVDAGTLLPEPVAETYVLLGIVVYLRARGKGCFGLAVLAGLCLGLALMAKEPAVFIGIAVGIHALVERRIGVAAGLLLGATACLAGELTYHGMVTGDPLLRLNSLATHEASPMAVSANENLAYRLFKAYPRIMLVPTLRLGVHSVLALCGGVIGVFMCSPGIRALLGLWIVLPWLYLNFGSSSFDHFFALPAAARYLEFTYPPLFLLAALSLDRTLAEPRRRRLAVTGIAVLLASGIYCGVVSGDAVPRVTTVRLLRDVAAQAAARGVTRAVVRQDPEPANVQVRHRWRRAFTVLAPRITVLDPGTTNRVDATVFIHVDAAGQVIARFE